jgi:hypothetical protein
MFAVSRVAQYTRSICYASPAAYRHFSFSKKTDFYSGYVFDKPIVISHSTMVRVESRFEQPCSMCKNDAVTTCLVCLDCGGSGHILIEYANKMRIETCPGCNGIEYRNKHCGHCDARVV